MEVKTYSTLFLNSLEMISESYNVKYSKRAFSIYQKIGNDFWIASFLCGFFLVDGQLKITVTSQIKPYGFDEIQFSIIDPAKKHRITDALRVNASFAAGSLQIDSKIYYLPCGDPTDFADKVKGYVRDILDELFEKRTAFLTSATANDGGLLPYLMNHWQDIPLEAGMAYLYAKDYSSARQCFELAEKKHIIWLKSIGRAGRYLHLIYIDYCKAMQSGVEWSDDLVVNGFPEADKGAVPPSGNSSSGNS